MAPATSQRREDSLAQPRDQIQGEQMVAQYGRTPTRPRIRDHGRFWLVFTTLVVVAILLATATFMTFGMTTAAWIVLLEASLALALGIR
jgi:hypothetical protein